jgi:hypothetical protein
MGFIRRFFAKIEADESYENPSFGNFMLACIIGQLEVVFDSGKFSKEYQLERENIKFHNDDD